MWLETSTVTPAAPISRISSMKRARCPGSIPVIGSSSTSRAGWWTIAPATLVRWRSPLDSPLRRRSASGAMSTSAMARSAAAPGSFSPWSSACSRTYERTVSRGYSRSPSGTTPIARYSIGSRWMGRPNSSTSPWEGWSSPQMAFRVVVLPAPLGPSSPVTPGPSSNDRSATATTSPYHLENRRSSTTAPAAGCPLMPAGAARARSGWRRPRPPPPPSPPGSRAR